MLDVVQAVICMILAWFLLIITQEIRRGYVVVWYVPWFFLAVSPPTSRELMTGFLSDDVIFSGITKIMRLGGISTCGDKIDGEYVCVTLTPSVIPVCYYMLSTRLLSRLPLG